MKQELWECICGYQEPYRQPTREEQVLYGGNIPHSHSSVNEKGHRVEGTCFMYHVIIDPPDEGNV